MAARMIIMTVDEILALTHDISYHDLCFKINIQLLFQLADPYLLRVGLVK